MARHQHRGRRRSTTPTSGARRARSRRRRSPCRPPRSSRATPIRGRRDRGLRRRCGRAPRTEHRVEPALGIQDVAGRRSVGPRGRPCLGDVTQPIERRPRPLRVHVVGGHRATHRPSRRCRRRAVHRSRRRGWAGRGGRRQAAGGGRGDRPGELLRRTRRLVLHARAGSGRKPDDHLLHVAVTPVGLGDGQQRLDASSRPSPMPTRMPVVGGCWPPAASSVARRRRVLVGGTAMAGTRVQRLDHHPWLGDTGRRAASSSAWRAPALAWGSRPVSSSTLASHGRQVVQRRLEAVVVEPPPGHVGAGPLAQREQGLVAPRAARAGDGQHLVGREVRSRQARRGWANAVAAGVAAEHRQGDEDLGRVGDPVP